MYMFVSGNDLLCVSMIYQLDFGAILEVWYYYFILSMFSSFFQDREKQDQLNELLNTYSANGIPPMPDLLTLGQPESSETVFTIESHWSSIVENASVSLYISMKC